MWNKNQIKHLNGGRWKWKYPSPLPPGLNHLTYCEEDGHVFLNYEVENNENNFRPLAAASTGFSPPKSTRVYLSLKLGGATAPLMDGNIWWGLLSSIWTWVSCSSEQCCRVFSLQQDSSSRRLIYSDKLDLIHRLLSSIYLATGLCRPIDIRTECWYQISYSGHKSYGWGGLKCDVIWG